MRLRHKTPLVGSPTLHIDPMTWRRIREPHGLDEPRALGRIMAWVLATATLFAVTGALVAMWLRLNG